MKNKQNLAVVFMVILSVALGCDSSPVSLEGRIVDDDGNPIARARLIVVQDAHKSEWHSDANGLFMCFADTSPFNFRPSTVRLTIVKEGFETFEAEYDPREFQPASVDKDDFSRVIVLSKIKS